MHFHLADAYQETGSRLHHMDARIKLVVVISLILLIGLTPSGAFGTYIGFFILIMAVVLVARLDPWMVVRRSFVALPFTLAAISLVFTVPGPALINVPLVNWPVSEPGLVRFTSIMLKSMLSVQVAVILLLTTHFTDTLWALGELRVPRILVAVITFMYRYIFLIAEESIRLTRARDARSAVIGGDTARGRSLAFRAQTTGRMIGNLFLRSFERSERIYQAMLARGYRGEIRHLSPPPVPIADGILGAIVCALSLALMLSAVLR